METIKISLPESGREIPVRIDRKRMKNCRLKVHGDGSVSCSVPGRTSMSWILTFLEEKAGWVEKKLKEAEQRKERFADRPVCPQELTDGASVAFLGESLTLRIEKGNKNRAFQEGNVLFLFCREPENPDQVRKIFDLWWRKRGLEFLYHRTDQWYFSVKKYGIPYPRLFLRKMKSLWGSCSVTRNKITFNFYLLSQEADCIDYVVLHELIHFRYPNHSREFYAYLESLMPDWRERKNRLNQSS